MSTFRCGHPREPHNYSDAGGGYVRCRQCRIERDTRRNRARGIQPRLVAPPEAPPGLHYDIAARDATATGSQSLLKALWKAHAPILRSFDERGYQVARP